MKQSKKVFLALLTLLCLLTSLMPVSVFAAPRNYTVRFYGGNIGTINGTATVTAAAGDPITVPGVTPKSGYYFKGFIESGKNQKEFITPGSVYAVKDADYIGVYGIDGTQVKYTVQYLLSGTTTKLAPDGTFYAGVGDRPISSYIYIEGYIPANRSTRTLVSDESQNVLVCYYNAPSAPAATTTGGAAGAAVAGAGAAVAGANAAGGAANAAANGANAANPVQANPANPTVAGANAVNPNAAAPAPAPQQQYAQTEDILDLDVPLAAPEGSALPSAAPAIPAVSAPPVIQPQDANKTGLPTWALVGGGVVGVGLIALLYWYLLFYRKKKKYADIDDLFRE